MFYQVTQSYLFLMLNSMHFFFLEQQLTILNAIYIYIYIPNEASIFSMIGPSQNCGLFVEIFPLPSEFIFWESWNCCHMSHVTFSNKTIIDAFLSSSMVQTIIISKDIKMRHCFLKSGTFSHLFHYLNFHFAAY